MFGYFVYSPKHGSVAMCNTLHEAKEYLKTQRWLDRIFCYIRKERRW